MRTICLFAAVLTWAAFCRCSPTASPHPPAAETDIPQRRYDGLTIDEWRERIKDLDPAGPQAATAVPGLIAIVRDPQAPWTTRRQAALTLGRIGRPAKEAVGVLVSLLGARDPAGESAAVWAAKALALFGSTAKSAGPELVELAGDANRPLVERAAAVEALARIGTAYPPGVKALIELLRGSVERPDRGEGPATRSDHDADEGALRVLAAQALGLIGGEARTAVPALMRAVREENELLRRTAAATLGTMGQWAAPAVPTLAEAMLVDDSPAVRDAAGEALGRIGSPAVPVLTRLLADREPATRIRSAAALGTIGRSASSAAPDLQKLLDEERVGVRLAAAEALWRIRGDAPAVVPTVVAALTDRDRQRRMQAHRLLVELGEASRSRASGMRFIREPLEKLLGHGRGDVRRIAKKTLEEIERIGAGKNE